MSKPTLDDAVNARDLLVTATTPQFRAAYHGLVALIEIYEMSTRFVAHVAEQNIDDLALGVLQMEEYAEDILYIIETHLDVTEGGNVGDEAKGIS